jgi:hypothetical protein
MSIYTNHTGVESDLRAEIAQLKALNDRYTEALRSIAHGPVGYWNEPQYAQKVISDLMQKAHDALHPKER